TSRRRLRAQAAGVHEAGRSRAHRSRRLGRAGESCDSGIAGSAQNTFVERRAQRGDVATIRVSIINESGLVAPAEAQTCVAALQRQVTEHFAPAWGIDAALSYVAPGAKPIAGSWWLVILDDSDQAGALGYHD